VGPEEVEQVVLMATAAMGLIQSALRPVAAAPLMLARFRVNQLLARQGIAARSGMRHMVVVVVERGLRRLALLQALAAILAVVPEVGSKAKLLPPR
jgi:hypothetical protein